jgi:hypothetical protein
MAVQDNEPPGTAFLHEHDAREPCCRAVDVDILTFAEISAFQPALCYAVYGIDRP